MTHDISTLETEFEAALAAVTRADNGPFAGDGHAQHGDHRAAHALWCAVTKEARHEQRTAATLAAARVVATSWGLAPTPAATALALLIDKVGLGGTSGLGGASGGTSRVGAFKRLGKGRKFASDGSCWLHALDRALHQTAPFGGFICDGPGETGLILAVYPHRETYCQDNTAIGWGDNDPDWRPDFYDDADDAWWVSIPASCDLTVLTGRLALLAVGIPWDDLLVAWPLNVSVATGRRAAALYDACLAAMPTPPPPASDDW
jgi:hypothetical protein